MKALIIPGEPNTPMQRASFTRHLYFQIQNKKVEKNIAVNAIASGARYDWEIHKGRLEVFDKYGCRYIFDISVFIALK
jgi:hypothetical protein